MTPLTVWQAVNGAVQTVALFESEQSAKEWVDTQKRFGHEYEVMRHPLAVYRDGEVARSKAMKIYLSGPMSGLKNFNYPEFHRCSESLRKKGYEVVSPAEIVPTMFDGKWDKCMRICITAVFDADAVVVMEGWENSRGARLEVLVALAAEIPILKFDKLERFYPMGMYRVQEDVSPIMQALLDEPEKWVFVGGMSHVRDKVTKLKDDDSG